tara:strand:- start:349 stop:471 length:123 start_codon:yes stop_codon:yes gene_type:complete
MNRLAVGDFLGVLKIYDLVYFNCIKKIEAHDMEIINLDFI